MSQAVTAPTFSAAWKMSEPLRVLVVEHTMADAELNLLELQRAGFQCRAHIVRTQKEFLDHLGRFEYNVILADYQLPGWTGMEAFSLLRKTGREVPFILVTGTLGEEIAVECIKQGVTDYVLKDHIARLPVVVARALEEKSLRDARVFMIEALRQSEASSRFLFRNNPLPMWVFNRQNLQFLEVNEAARAHYKYSQMEFLHMRITDLHPAEEVPRLLRVLKEGSARAGLPEQWHHRLKDGSLIDVEIILHYAEFSGSAVGLAVAQDITERKRAEEEKQKFFTLVENSRDFIGVADLQGNLLYVNPAGRALLGMEDSKAAEGTQLREQLAIEDLPVWRDTIFPAIVSSGQWQGEALFHHRRTGRAIPMDFVGFLVKDPQTGGPRFVAIVSRDIAERRALEQQLQQAQKFEAIGQLVGGIAHDFNNVIGAILGWSELGAEQADSPGARLGDYFKKIHSQCDRVTALIQQLLAFARRQILAPRNLSLNQSVREVMSLLDKVIGKDIELKVVLAEDLAIVRADVTQIEQVLMNLCLNARDAMPDGGKLLIETQNIEFSKEICRRKIDPQPGRYAGLSVTDTGIGMDSAVQERIFEPFFTTKASGRGTGLGLATVHGIVKQHGGFIEVESAPGRGSTFRVFLPASGDTAQVETSPPVVGAQVVRGGTETILIAEDHDGVREMAGAALKSLGYQVLLAHDGREAVRIFTAHRDNIAIVLLDVVMPQGGGWDAYAAITKLKPGVPVIFATGYSSETGALTEMVGRGIPVLQKPYSPAQLGRRIRELLDLTAGGSPAQT